MLDWLHGLVAIRPSHVSIIRINAVSQCSTKDRTVWTFYRYVLPKRAPKALHAESPSTADTRSGGSCIFLDNVFIFLICKGAVSEQDYCSVGTG